MSNFVESVKLFNKIAGTKEEFNPKMVSLYMGLILEEVGEMLEALNIDDESVIATINRLENLSHDFKCNEFEESIVSCIDRVAFLDGAVDVAVVALGAGISNGADVVGACKEVTDSNLSKFPVIDGQRVVLKDKNGKIVKPNDWKAPQLAQYLRENI